MMTIEPKRFVWRRSWGTGKRNLTFGFSFFNSYKTTAVVAEFWDLKRGIMLSKHRVQSRHVIEIDETSLAWLA